MSFFGAALPPTSPLPQAGYGVGQSAAARRSQLDARAGSTALLSSPSGPAAAAPNPLGGSAGDLKTPISSNTNNLFGVFSGAPTAAPLQQPAQQSAGSFLYNNLAAARPVSTSTLPGQALGFGGAVQVTSPIGGFGQSLGAGIGVPSTALPPSFVAPGVGLYAAAAAPAIGPAVNPIVNVLGVDEKEQGMQKALRFIDQCITRDEKQLDLREYVDQMEVIYEPIFERRQLAMLPSVLIEQYQNLQYKSFMGVFPEIHRAWLTIDNKLFIWSYLDGSDFTEYDQLDQVIVSVGLVKPRRNFFNDQKVKYILVLATAVEIYFVAVSFSAPASGTRGSPFVQLGLLAMPYSVSSDNVIMNKICGTDEGRIFLCGQDGCLYEVVYEPEESWFRRKCRLVNHTQSFMTMLVPQFLQFQRQVPISDLVVDKERHLLYTLSNDSILEVYDLGEQGQTLQKAATFKEIAEKARDMQQRLRLSTDAVRITSISPISTQESKEIHLLAISSNGDRFYFSVEGYSIRRPSGLRLVTAKPNPAIQALASTGAPAQQSAVDFQESFYSKGALVMADTRAEGMDTLYCVGTETAAVRDQYSGLPSGTGSFSRTRLSESFTKLEIQGKVLAIAEVQLDEDDSLAEISCYNELVRQNLSPPREFVCLVNTGIVFLTKLRPVDRLKQILQQNSDQALLAFFTKYGYDEALAMCISIYSTKDTPLLQNVTNALLVYGGEPRLSTSPIAAALGVPQPTAAPFEFGQPITGQQDTCIYSPLHNAAYIAFSRLVRPLWKQTIIQYKPVTAADGTQQQQPLINPRITSSKALEEVSASLVSLRSFFEVLLSRPRMVKTADDIPNRLQQQSLVGLYLMLSRCLEQIGLVELLNQCNLQALLRPQFIPEDRIRRLSELKFKDLVTSVEGEAMLKELVRLVIDKSPARAVETLIKNLEDNCRSFFNADDITDFKAQSLLQQALRFYESGNVEQAKDLSEKARELYLKIAGRSRIVDIVCRLFQRMKHYNTVITLALMSAQSQDPNNVALRYVDQGKIPTDVEGKLAYDKRMTCYQCAINVLVELDQQAASQSEKDTVIAKMLESTDTLFLETLFSYLKNRSMDELLRRAQNSPFLEQYLKKETNLQVQAQYYANKGQFDKAAKSLQQYSELAAQIPIEERIQAMSRAVLYAKNSIAQGELVKVLEDKLQIANEQKRILTGLEALLPSCQTQEQRAAMEAAILELRFKLLPAEQLYNSYADKFKLYESCLAILHVCNHYDTKLINQLWLKVFVSIKNMDLLEAKLIELGKRFWRHGDQSSVVFPLDYIVAMLEVYLLETADQRQFRDNDFQRRWVISLFRSIGISYLHLYLAYHRIYLHLFARQDQSETLSNQQLVSPATVTASTEDLNQLGLVRTNLHITYIKLAVLYSMVIIAKDWQYDARPEDRQIFSADRLEADMIDIGQALTELQQVSDQEMRSRIKEVQNLITQIRF